LKTIGTPGAIQTIVEVDKSKMDESIQTYAEDIVAEASTAIVGDLQRPITKEVNTGYSFRSIFEDNVEYLKIPGGNYTYSVSKKMVTVPDLYLCKYPVTNKRFRRFIAYLQGKERELEKEVSVEGFSTKLLEFAKNVKGYSEYLGKDSGQWQAKLRSGFEDYKNFNNDDQPVIGITWYAARAYCFWLSLLEAAANRDDHLLNGDISELASLYRLPMEKEWEWEAGGEPDGSIRVYPWLNNKSMPNPVLANYGGNVGATTPVGRYPEGATPTGLMDMAGNVWEWMENWFDKENNQKALRGGSWHDFNDSLRTSSRMGRYPYYYSNYIGFRVVCGRIL
jgi:formylglycine-generating enzyme required for sulfatase activity